MHMEKDDLFGFERKHRAKHFMVASASRGYDTRMAIFDDRESVEVAYRLWSREKVDRDDIKAIRNLSITESVIGGQYTIMIGNIASKGALHKAGLDHEPEFAYLDEGDKYICYGMAKEPIFVSKVVHRTIPYMSLESYKTRHNE